MARNNWTDKELIFLKENYNKMTYPELTKKLKKTKGSIYLTYQKNYAGKEVGFNKEFKTEKTISKDLIMYVLKKNKLMSIRECLIEII